MLFPILAVIFYLAIAGKESTDSFQQPKKKKKKRKKKRRSDSTILYI